MFFNMNKKKLRIKILNLVEECGMPFTFVTDWISGPSYIDLIHIGSIHIDSARFGPICSGQPYIPTIKLNLS